MYDYKCVSQIVDEFVDNTVVGGGVFELRTVTCATFKLNTGRPLLLRWVRSFSFTVAFNSGWGKSTEQAG